MPKPGLKTIGLLMILATSAALALSFKGEQRSVYLPGPTSAGHYQIELACSSCHTDAFTSKQQLQAACLRCHGDELKRVDDSHPERKFSDPRNADRTAVLDARLCITCHREHRPEVTSAMGLSLPADYCYRCHSTVADERPSHRGMAFDTCAAAGCHNFHDNQALYEDFLARHLDDPDLLVGGKSPDLGREPARRSFDRTTADARDTGLSGAELDAWEKTAHAMRGVNCSGCHGPAGGGAGFERAVSGERCGSCHELQRKQFLASRHGMREAAGLGAMKVGDARLPMHANARERELGCTSCHTEHGFDTRRAAVDACLDCHADPHSAAYRDSPHARLWQEDPSGRSGASCATCHLPRVDDGHGVHVLHNQNDTLRPNEKMAREVCLDCHGLGFTLDALADPALVLRNFRGRPSRHVQSLDLVRKRLSTH
jgi:hypothetical protein